MFGPDYEAGCPSCSAIADGFNGFAIHLASHNVTLSAVSRAPLAKLQAYKQRMGWTFPWASSFGSLFVSRELTDRHSGQSLELGRLYTLVLAIQKSASRWMNRLAVHVLQP